MVPGEQAGQPEQLSGLRPPQSATGCLLKAAGAQMVPMGGSRLHQELPTPAQGLKMAREDSMAAQLSSTVGIGKRPRAGLATFCMRDRTFMTIFAVSVDLPSSGHFELVIVAQSVGSRIRMKQGMV